MLSKPFSLIVVYLLAIINFTILLLPLLAAIIPFVDFNDGRVILSNTLFGHIKTALIFLVFAVSFLMLCYLFLDFIFGFTYRSTLKGAKRYDKIKEYQFLDQIFSQVKKRFAEKGVKLYIKNSDEVNAFAIGGAGRKAIVLTTGMIRHYSNCSSSDEEFLIAIRGIMGHEMSHLINKDFIPGLLLIINQKVTNFILRLLKISLNLFINILSRIHLNGRFVNYVIVLLYDIIDWIMRFFNRHIIYNLYEFIRRYISRGIEYRCDKQSAKAFGGYNMGLALKFLGNDGYFTLFSTHPATKRRIAKVVDTQISQSTIRPSIITSLTNYFSWMLLVIICLYFAKLAKIDLFTRKYLIENHQQIYIYLHQALSLVKKFAAFLF